jgi:hypothetical protein
MIIATISRQIYLSELSWSLYVNTYYDVFPVLLGDITD